MQIFVYVYVSFFLRFKRRVSVLFCVRDVCLLSARKSSLPFLGLFDDDDDDDDDEKFLSSRFRADESA